MKKRPITDEEKTTLFVIVDDENRDMFLKLNDEGEMETAEGIEDSLFFTSEEVKEFLAEEPTGWYVMTFGEALEQEKEEFEMAVEE